MDSLITTQQLAFLFAVTDSNRKLTREDLDEALGRPVATFVGEPLYSTAFARAAAVMDSLVARGHRALAALAAAFWLDREGYRLEADPKELRNTVLANAAGAKDVDAIAEWLEANSRLLA